MSSMVVMLVVTGSLVRMFAVSAVPVVIGRSFWVTTAIGSVTFFSIRVTTAIGMSLLDLVTLVVLRFVSPPLSRFVFPIIRQCKTGATKDDNDNNIKDVRRFHQLPPMGPKRVVIIMS